MGSHLLDSGSLKSHVQKTIQSKLQGNTRLAKRCHNPEDPNLQGHRCENSEPKFKCIQKSLHVPLHIYIELHELNVRSITHSLLSRILFHYAAESCKQK